MIIHDHWSCWSCMKFVDHAMIRYWSCMISVDHAMKGCWSCMKSVDHAMKGCWSYMMINDHCHERLLIIHDQHWSVYHIVTTTAWPAQKLFCPSKGPPKWPKWPKMDVWVMIWGIFMHVNFLHIFLEFLRFFQSSVTPGYPGGGPRGLGGGAPKGVSHMGTPHQ